MSAMSRGNDCRAAVLLFICDAPAAIMLFEIAREAELGLPSIHRRDSGSAALLYGKFLVSEPVPFGFPVTGIRDHGGSWIAGYGANCTPTLREEPHTPTVVAMSRLLTSPSGPFFHEVNAVVTVAAPPRRHGTPKIGRSARYTF